MFRPYLPSCDVTVTALSSPYPKNVYTYINSQDIRTTSINLSFSTSLTFNLQENI